MKCNYFLPIIFCFISIQCIAHEDILSIIKANKDKWRVIDSLSLDLNLDHINDYIVVLQSKEPKKYEDTNYHPDTFYYPKMLIILFGQPGGGYQKKLETSKIFGTDYNCGVQFQDPYAGISKRKNSFIMQFSSGGSGNRQIVTYFFKYMKNDFYLSGAEFEDYEMPLAGGADHIVSENYLTGKKVEYDVSGGSSTNYQTKKMKVKPLTKLADFDGSLNCL